MNDFSLARTDLGTQLSRSPIVMLTTWRQSGVVAPTVVWAAPERDGVVVLTPSTSGQVKRIRNNFAVTVQSATMRGRLLDKTLPVNARAEIFENVHAIRTGNAALVRKFTLALRILFAWEDGKSSTGPARVILGITAEQ